jgi:hypothetical protein
MNATRVTYIVQAAGIGGIAYGAIALAHHYGPLIGLVAGALLLLGGGWYRASIIEKKPVSGIGGAIKG